MYISTAINYANGAPHCGHAYEIVIADILSRFYKQLNQRTFLLTGSDEHGEKIQNSSGVGEINILNLEEKLTMVKKYCDTKVQGFLSLNHDLGINYDNYIRTTSTEHKTFARSFWNKVCQSNDIYKDQYEGWYCVREEKFISETKAIKCNYIDTISGNPLTRVTEELYFFRLSKYQNQILEHIRNNPQFIQPEIIRNEIIRRLEAKPLKDISVTRKSIKWGIPIPNDPTHVMYVWFDALTNYLSGIPDINLWPAIHIIGKDITWFHSVVWLGMLMSYGLEPPKCIFSHGFILDKDGFKESKTLGNVTDPVQMITKYGSDKLRYYFIRQTPLGHDFSFNENALISITDADLVNNLGNLTKRILSLCKKYYESYGSELSFDDIDVLLCPIKATNIFCECIDKFDLIGYTQVLINYCNILNDYLTVQKPWTISVQQQSGNILAIALKSLHIILHYFYPIIPATISKLFANCGWDLVDYAGLQNIVEIPINNVNTYNIFERLEETRYKKQMRATE